MLYMAPIAVVVLLPAALVMEPSAWDVVLSLGYEHKLMWILLFVNSTMAYGANLCNFLVTKHTSALTLQVLSLSLSHTHSYNKRLFSFRCYNTLPIKFILAEKIKKEEKTRYLDRVLISCD